MEAIRNCLCGACESCRKWCDDEPPQRGIVQREPHPLQEAPHAGSTSSSEEIHQEIPLKDMDEPLISKAPSGAGDGSDKGAGPSGDPRSKPKDKPEGKTRLAASLVRTGSGGSGSGEELLAGQVESSGEGSGTSMGGSAEDTSTSPEEAAGKGPAKA
ncbi:uncharacterized protein LOC144105678 [Amblyomma americanum]